MIRPCLASLSSLATFELSWIPRASNWSCPTQFANWAFRQGVNGLVGPSWSLLLLLLNQSILSPAQKRHKGPQSPQRESSVFTARQLWRRRIAMEAQLSVRAILLLSLLPLLSLLARSSSSVSHDIQIVNAERRVCFQFLPKLLSFQFSKFLRFLNY